MKFDLDAEAGILALPLRFEPGISGFLRSSFPYESGAQDQTELPLSGLNISAEFWHHFLGTFLLNCCLSLKSSGRISRSDVNSPPICQEFLQYRFFDLHTLCGSCLEIVPFLQYLLFLAVCSPALLVYRSLQNLHLV